MNLTVVTASLDPQKTYQYWSSWRKQARGKPYKGMILLQGKQDLPPGFLKDFEDVYALPEPCGVVPAFASLVNHALQGGAEIIACLHDDLRIDKEGWDLDVLTHFEREPRCGLLGFSGADGLGEMTIYLDPYDPMQLARQGFFSNMQEAEKHGRREPFRRRSACCDGFSLIGRREFFQEAWQRLERLRIRHHFYDSWLGGEAHRKGWETWFLPIACHHAGGVNSVSPAYQEWASGQIKDGDHGFWQEAHRIGYEDLRGVLPIRVMG